jgi:hypothetical protein
MAVDQWIALTMLNEYSVRGNAVLVVRKWLVWNAVQCQQKEQSIYWLKFAFEWSNIVQLGGH